MRLLLDTHALIWFSGERDRLADTVVDTIEQAEAVFVSPASVYEMELKFALGKLPGVANLLPILPRYMRDMSFSELPLTIAHARLSGQLPLHHRDPFDRMLIAQAQIEDLMLVSNEQLFESFGVRRLW